MPEMNGFDATKYIRETLHSSIPIIALTADVTTVDLEKCRAVGMDDYIAKPVDEKILYSKIIGSVKRLKTGSRDPLAEIIKGPVLKYTDLNYLIQRTKSNPVLIGEMISLYLEQTPPLISVIKKSWQERDWSSLYAAVHKLIPSFVIMGISNDFEDMARKVQDFAKNQQQTDGISTMIKELENVCLRACDELKVDINKFKP